MNNLLETVKTILQLLILDTGAWRPYFKDHDVSNDVG
jgi:hypothetical protein